MPDGFDRETRSWNFKRRCLDPLVRVREDDDEIVVTADLPCVDREDIDLRVKEESLLIRASTRREIQFDSWGGAHRKVSFNSFRKKVSLPARVDPDRAEAEFKSGKLTVTLKKKEGKNIEIK